MADAWPAARAWDAEEDRRYSAFVARVGEGIAASRCRTLGQCLRDPAWNLLLYDGAPALSAQTQPLFDEADCADFAYLLRAYFAFARQLPFAFAARMEGDGPDVRFLQHARVAAFRRWDGFATPEQLFEALGTTVHSGMLRTAPGEEQSDFYSIAVRPGAVLPGDLFYDPGGHVLVVAAVHADGTPWFIDAHPDHSVTWSRLPASLTPGPLPLGGGFKRWRPLTLLPATTSDRGPVVRARNAELDGRDDGEQWRATMGSATRRAGAATSGRAGSYFDWVRARLGTPGRTTPPTEELRERLVALCRQLQTRAELVDGAVREGLPERAHPPTLPDNINATGGEWERWASPARDARLRAEVLALRGFLDETLRQAAPAARKSTRRALQSVYREAADGDRCLLAYRDSTGRPSALSLDEVLDRLFALSFDPWDCPERRWGAPRGSAELARCVAAPTTARFYVLEQRLRHRSERGWGEPTPLEAGPERPPPWDFRPLLGLPPRPRAK